MLRPGKLAGCRVALTRPSGRGEELARLLEGEGASVLSIPLVRLEPAPDPEALEQAVRRVWAGAFQWVVVTSPQGAQVMAELLRRLQPRTPGPRPQLPARIAAVGRATARVVEQAGFDVAAVPAEARGAAVPQAMACCAEGPPLQGSRVLVAVADRADPALQQELARRGAAVERVVAYRTVPDPEAARVLARRIRDGEVDVVVLTSPSATQALHEAMEEASRWGGPMAPPAAPATLSVVAIGPTTAQACRQAGFTVYTAASPAPGDLLGAVVAVWESRKLPPGDGTC